MIEFSLILSIEVENFNQRKLNKKVIERVITRLGLDETYTEPQIKIDLTVEEEAKLENLLKA